MTGAAAVLFTITVPTAVEEQRMRNVYVDKQMAEPTAMADTNTSEPETDAQSRQTISLTMSETVATPQSEAFPQRCNLLPTVQVQSADAPSCPALDLPVDTPIEQVLREILRKFKIAAVWLSNVEGSMYQITFTIEFNEVYEKLHEALQEWGIGDREGSTVSVMNCIATKSYVRYEEDEYADLSSNQYSANAKKHGAWNRFMNSVRSRLNVAQIVRDVRQDAAITFDFCILLVSAAVLASFGLVENSTIFLASSMLISPLMGPIIAAIFGTVIEERTLRRLGMQNELIGILLATVVGFLFGLVVCTTDKKYGIGEGLTAEMLSRCDLHSLIVGVFTAIPSGAAAAIGILGGNIGSLVGVAISASLLPPAVNSGLLWALACIYKLFENDDSRYLYVVKSHKYSNNQAAELAIHGSISMCLTLSNILCIYVMGILVLKVKEIAPVIARNNSDFWKHDIKLARCRAQHDIVSTDAAIMDEFTNLDKEDQRALGIDCEFLQELDKDSYQHTWSPIIKRNSFQEREARNSLSTIHRLEKLYTTITNTSERWQGKGLSRRTTQRAPDATSCMLPRPRFATMPCEINKLQVPQATAVVDVLNEQQTTKRFTVTPATDVLN
ncbi:uncharacterized protein LOC115628479 isoform X2 [Scaptodrosophila lebanonensis]|uniref:Uncharacterized protein LOC115628479 isoform X2 n=1 Tax=Drosophila lebanonensis TaxID=7225 RepID=A0A6J2U037_DROLE|nr:uncharacterized protein LOC115628479 isoform X2 [Scaptodrosophila lebanonensis]